MVWRRSRYGLAKDRVTVEVQETAQRRIEKRFGGSLSYGMAEVRERAFFVAEDRETAWRRFRKLVEAENIRESRSS